MRQPEPILGFISTRGWHCRSATRLCGQTRPAPHRRNRLQPAAHVYLDRGTLRRVPAKPSKTNPELTNIREVGSGTAPTGPLSTKETLSRPFELSLAGSPLRNVSVVELLVATNVVVNSSHVKLEVHVVQLFSKGPSEDPFSDTSTVLVVPKIPVGLNTLPT